MTQPVTDQSQAGQIIAAAAIGLALIAVEQQTRQNVEDAIQAAFVTLAAAGVLAASTAPATVITGIGLLSLASFAGRITTILDDARDKVTAAVQAGYTAGAQVARTQLADDLAQYGFTVPNELPTLGTNLDRLIADVDTMFGHSKTDLASGIAAAFDGVTGDNPTPGRVVAINDAVNATGDRLRQRAQAAAATAVHQGSTDAQQAIYTQLQNDTGIPGLMKRWRTTSNDPCGMCEALNGTLVGINAEFDAQATTDDKDLRRPWRTMLGPPRHPNCRCQLELVAT